MTLAPSSTRTAVKPARAAGTATAAGAGPAVARRQLGRYLRDWRTQAGLTIAEAARLMEWGASTLQRLEKGQADRIRSLDIQELCRIYGIPDDLRDALTGLAQQSTGPSWWHAHGEVIPEDFDLYPGIEAIAAELSCYQPELVPPLLQTPDYARALLRLARPSADDVELDHRVQVRVQRQAVLTRKSPARLTAVVHEAVLRRIVGCPKVMAAQLRQLADTSTRPNVTVLVLPFAAGLPVGEQTGAFTVLRFGAGAGRAVEPPLVHVAGFTGDLYLERPQDVARFEAAHDCLRHYALDAQASRRMLRQAAKEYAAQAGHIGR
ncbi:helix-turn-helix domain-containing protein [Nocardia farcinica]|uniref:helix-turn-helix domain-containing protein n=1 Tax=Nocardia farcinica TaxID=37329 RepID=UPI000D0A989C|nr:helix-turn-helix transcriptional regulator [Nocardia farcinica]